MTHKHRIFIYGTLKKGFMYHDEFLSKADYLGPVTSDTMYSLYVAPIPFLVKEATDAPVEGELYEVDEDTLYTIDRLEGHPRIYKRELIDVFTPAGERILAWAYLYPNGFRDKPYAFKETKYV